MRTASIGAAIVAAGAVACVAQTGSDVVTSDYASTTATSITAPNGDIDTTIVDRVTHAPRASMKWNASTSIASWNIAGRTGNIARRNVSARDQNEALHQLLENGPAPANPRALSEPECEYYLKCVGMDGAYKGCSACCEILSCDDMASWISCDY